LKERKQEQRKKKPKKPKKNEDEAFVGEMKWGGQMGSTERGEMMRKIEWEKRTK